MLEKIIQDELIRKGRAFIKGYTLDDPYEEEFESDQDLKRPQPALVKAAMRPESERILLQKDFSIIVQISELVR